MVVVAAGRSVIVFVVVIAVVVGSDGSRCRGAGGSVGGSGS